MKTVVTLQQDPVPDATVLQQQKRNGRSACTRMSWEALSPGQELAAPANQPLLAAVAGRTAAGLISELTAALTKARSA